MTRIVVKVCGITEERDALEAAHLGADALGFHFSASSPLQVEAAFVRRIVDRLPVFVHKVGVFADEPLIRVLETVREAGLTAIQFNGRELPQTCASISSVPWYKAFRVGSGFDPDLLGEYPCTTYLLEAAPGEGSTWEWRRARALSLYGRVMIGGGLDPTNVALAIEDARPYGVDVGSGVEFSAGKKDLDRLENFIAAVRRAERRIDEPSGRVP